MNTKRRTGWTTWLRPWLFMLGWCSACAVQPLWADQISPSTLLLTVSLDRNHITVEQGVSKALVFQDSSSVPGPFHYQLLSRDGRVVYRQDIDLPQVCTDPRHQVNDPPHFEQDRAIPHQVTVTVKVPQVAGACALQWFHLESDGHQRLMGTWAIPQELRTP